MPLHHHRWSVALVSVSGLAAASCVAPPPLAQATNNFPFTGSIPIHDVVQRVKCDLADALYAKVYQSKDPLKFAWMQNWTAKADLTLEIDNTGGITPSVSYTWPLPNAYVFGLGPNSINTSTGAVTNVVSATSQNFTLGASGTFSGSATRTETLSFNISMAELKEWKANRQKLINSGQKLVGIYSCDPTAPTDVQASLDLKSWLDEALRPVELGDLQVGIHPTPGQATAPAASKTPPASAGPGGTKALSTTTELPSPTISSAREKAFLDLSLSTYLTELAVPYDLNDEAYYEPTDQPDKACATGNSAPGKLVTFRPPAYPNSSSSSQNQQSLVQQSLTNAQNAQSAAAEVLASNNLDAQLKQKAHAAATAARVEALRVQLASQYAAQHVLAVCEADTQYVKPDRCISPPASDSRATKTGLRSSNDHALVGEPVTLTATVTVSESGKVPSGKLTFKDADTTLAVQQLKNGTAVLETKFATTGTHSITTTYSSDDSSSGSAATIVQTVASNGSRTTLTVTPNPSDAGTLVIFVATVTASVGTPTGSVTFKVDDILLGHDTVDTGGRARYATSSLAVGNHSIVAEYAGSDTLASSASTPISQSVRGGGKDPKYQLWSSANPSATKQLITFTERVGDTNGHLTPTGYVTFVERTENGMALPLHDPILINNGKASYSIASLPAGTASHVIQAIYSGDKNFNSATATLRQYVVTSLAGIRYVVVQLSPYYCTKQGYHDELDQLISNQVIHAQRSADLAKKYAALAANYLTPDPPFESIGQALNFVVTVGASASPNWSLVRFKGPSGGGGTLASLMGVRTHSLNIAMGPVTATTEVSRVLTNAATRQAIQGLQQ